MFRQMVGVRLPLGRQNVFFKSFLHGCVLRTTSKNSCSVETSGSKRVHEQRLWRASRCWVCSLKSLEYANYHASSIRVPVWRAHSADLICSLLLARWQNDAVVTSFAAPRR